MPEVVSREMNSMEKIFLIDELQYRRKTDASDLSVGLQQKLSGWHEWAKFEVPHDPLPLRSKVSIAGGRVTICNEDSGAWMHPLIRITDDYLATTKRIDSGE